MDYNSKRVPIPMNGVDYRGKVVLAPMVRSGELPSRLLALKYGADLVWGPETIDKSMIGTTKRISPYSSTVDYTRTPSNISRHPGSAVKESLIYRLHPGQEGRRLIFQIGTSSPSTAVEAAKLVAPHVAGIDVNAGCPKPFSTSGGMGAALLQTPDHLASILAALVKEVGEVFGIGISVKIRLLESAEATEALVKKLCATGITGLTVHCRTTPMRPRERAIRHQLRMIADTCRKEGVACLMNGDVKNKDEALQLMHEFGVDGAMIATAAESNPSSFRTKEEGGLLPWWEVTQEYIKIALDVDNKWGNTKFTLGQLIPGKTDVYRKVTGAKNYTQVCEALSLQNLSMQAAEVDERLGLPYIHDTSGIENAKSQNKVTKAASGQPSAKQPMDFENRRPLSERGVGTFAMTV
ncbi:MAG: hypothetical protein Q9186_005547 [Xanthomendoza sp. 1 TL-2023]